MIGNYPFVIGGWAVWAYTKGLGSRDLDIVLPVKDVAESILIPFYQTNGYEKRGGPLGFGKYIAKIIKVGGREEEFYLDVSSYQDHNYFHEGRSEGYELSWKLLEKYNQLWKLEDLIARIPTIELLLLSKIKAYLDRNYDLRQKGIHEADLVRIRSKI